MSTMTTTQTTQVYSIFIKAAPEQVWDAITTPEFTERYFHGVRIELREWDEAVLECDPPRRLVHRWIAAYDPEAAAEEPSRVTWELEAQEDGTTKLTVVHDELEASPKTAASVAGGWSYVLSNLKTLLETGEPLQG
jgi:uncharacterized protein YndB with AHSA1/START domain